LLYFGHINDDDDTQLIDNVSQKGVFDFFGDIAPSSLNINRF